MIEKAEDGDGELLGHLMLTARKVAQEQGLEKVGWGENWAKKQEQLLSQHYMSTCYVMIVTHPGIPSGCQQWSGGLPVSVPSAHPRPRRSPAQLAPWLRLTSSLGKSLFFETTFCNLLIFHGFRLCFCTQGLKNDFALFLPLPLPRLTQSVRFLCQHVLLVAWHPILPIIISEHVDKRGLPTPSVQTFREFPCIVFKD